MIPHPTDIRRRITYYDKRHFDAKTKPGRGFCSANDCTRLPRIAVLGGYRHEAYCDFHARKMGLPESGEVWASITSKRRKPDHRLPVAQERAVVRDALGN